MHSNGGDNTANDEKGRDSLGFEGEIIAELGAGHDGFWRNSDSWNVTVTVYVRGEYAGRKDATALSGLSRGARQMAPVQSKADMILGHVGWQPKHIQRRSR